LLKTRGVQKFESPLLLRISIFSLSQPTLRRSWSWKGNKM